MDREPLELTLHTKTLVLTGSILQPQPLRLLDLLNSTFDSELPNSGTFLELSGVTMSDEKGIVERHPHAYINKSTIDMVVTLTADSARGRCAKVGPKVHPFVRKSPVSVSLQIPGYTLD